VSSFAFVGEVVDVLAIFPQGHALIVVSATVLVADPMRIADEEGPNLLFDTEVDHYAGGFVPQVAHTPLGATALFVFGSLQLLPAPRILFTPSLLPGNLAQLLASLVFERTDTAPGDDHGLASIGSDGCQMNLAQVYCGLDSARDLFCLWSFHAHMQLKATIPDQATGSAVFRQRNWQDQGRTPFAHRQNHTPTLIRDGLSRPLDRIKTFGPPGVLHLHLGMSLAELACGFDVGEEGGHDHLYRLAMQRETPLGSFLQGISTRPLRMVDPCCFVRLHTSVPHLRCFHLSGFAALGLLGRQMLQSVDFYRLHGYNITMYEDSLQVGKTRYTHYSIAYHLVWIPKYRRRILTGEVQKETKRLLEECCQRQGLTLLALETDEDHIHVFVSAPPRFSPALIANLLKGYSSRYLRQQFPKLNKVCGKEHLWTSSYYVGTAGNVSAAIIKRYIQECQGK
jgi:putative transposase